MLVTICMILMDRQYGIFDLRFMFYGLFGLRLVFYGQWQ